MATKQTDPPLPTLVIDTREQQAWTIDGRNWPSPVEVRKLDTGDYSMAGFESVVTVERKASVLEFAGWVYQDRCEDELRRMLAIPLSFVFLDFKFTDIVDYPRVPSVPFGVRKRVRITGRQLLKRLHELELAHPHVRWFCTEGRGRDKTLSLFKRVFESYGQRGPTAG
jgi:hypothetical protein